MGANRPRDQCNHGPPGPGYGLSLADLDPAVHGAAGDEGKPRAPGPQRLDDAGRAAVLLMGPTGRGQNRDLAVRLTREVPARDRQAWNFGAGRYPRHGRSQPAPEDPEVRPRAVPHHLIDHPRSRERYSAGEVRGGRGRCHAGYLGAAACSRLFVGGTMLYVSRRSRMDRAAARRESGHFGRGNRDARAARWLGGDAHRDWPQVDPRQREDRRKDAQPQFSAHSKCSGQPGQPISQLQRGPRCRVLGPMSRVGTRGAA